MNAFSGKRLLVAWLALSAITLFSMWMGLRGGDGAITADAAVTTAAIVIALLKVRVIFREFMEVSHAPVLLGRITDIWLLVTAACLLGAYFVGMGRAAA